MNLTSIEAGIIAWVQGLLPALFIIPGDSNNPEPASTHVVVRIGGIQRVGEDNTRAPDADGIAEISGNREFYAYLQVIGPGGLQACQDIADAFFKESVKADLLDLGLSYVGNEPVQNLTGLIEATNVERGGVDVRFRTVSTQSEDQGVIASATYSGTYSKG